MNPEDVLRHRALRLTEAQRRQYFADGVLAIENAFSSRWVERLRSAAADMVEASRACAESNAIFALDEGHSAHSPRLHRLYSPQDHQPAFWEFIRSDEMTSLAADVVGPDVKFHHAKLNFKTGRGSRGFDWHQDIQAWPHTDYSPVTIGVYLDGCREDQGPLACVRGSNNGELYSMYDDAGQFAVRARDEDIDWVTDDLIEAPTGGPGTALLLHCRTLHGSRINESPDDRPLLLVVYSSADSFAYTSPPIDSPRLGEIVRGRPARYANFDPRPCELPPDWRRVGYAGPWRLQAQADRPPGD